MKVRQTARSVRSAGNRNKCFVLQMHARHAPEDLSKQGQFDEMLLKPSVIVQDLNDSVVCPWAPDTFVTPKAYFESKLQQNLNPFMNGFNWERQVIYLFRKNCYHFYKMYILYFQGQSNLIFWTMHTFCFISLYFLSIHDALHFSLDRELRSTFIVYFLNRLYRRLFGSGTKFNVLSGRCYTFVLYCALREFIFQNLFHYFCFTFWF